MQLDGGVWDVYNFDPVDQLTQVKYSASSSSGTLPQRTVGYDWDPVGNRTQVQSIETNGPVTTDTYATANAVNQYPSLNGSPLGYDSNGNLTSAAVGGVFDPASPSTALAYDSQNRLTSITATPGGGGSPSLALTQVHDSRNRVIARTINGVTTLFVWDDWDLIEERDLSGSLLRRHVHGAAIDEIIMSVDANGARYRHHDALGSVTALTDETGAVVESYTYDVFGQPTVFDAAGIPQPAFQSPPSGNRFLYTGREWIAEAGLYDYRNRHYSPILGRFLQTDPIRFDAGDVNLYRYVGNSVLSWTDPFGLDPGIIFIARDQSPSGSLSKSTRDMIDSGKVVSPYAGIESAAKEKGMEVKYDADPKDVRNASKEKNPDGSPKNDEVIYYDHGSDGGKLGLNAELELEDIFSPTDGGKRTILSCHSDKVVSPEKKKKFAEGGTDLGTVPAVQNRDGTVSRGNARDALAGYLRSR